MPSPAFHGPHVACFYYPGAPGGGGDVTVTFPGNGCAGDGGGTANTPGGFAAVSGFGMFGTPRTASAAPAITRAACRCQVVPYSCR